MFLKQKTKKRKEKKMGMKILRRALVLLAITAIVLVASLALGACSNSAKAAADAAAQNTASKVLASEAQDNSGTTVAAAAEDKNISLDPSETGAKEMPQEIKVTDGMGSDVTLDGPAQKIIVFVPSALEIINGLDAMDRVIGVDSWSAENKEPLADGLEGFGDFNSLNMEKIAAAGPDIIIGLVGWAEADIQKLNDLDIKVYIVDANTVSEVYTEIINMGKILGLNDEALIMSDELKKQVDEITSKVPNLEQSQKPKVFYEVWNEPLMSAGKNTFISELIEMSGGINIVAADGLEGWPEYSLEKLIQNNPDIMIAPVSLASDAGAILSEARFSKIAAITNKRVYIIPDNPVSRPSQNIIKGLTMIAQAIHPGIFGEFKAMQ
jgi:iron complex transport system substrate-binding protein